MGNCMKKQLYKVWSKFLKFFGDIKCFKHAFWLVYDPDDFEVNGEKVAQICKLLQPGDVILRGYNKYLDGKFIPSKDGWSHGALYIGNWKIVHAIAEGVSLTNVIDFTRCDRIAVFRPKTGQQHAVEMAKKFLEDKVPYDFGFKHGTSALYCFELCAECYSALDIPTYEVKHLFGLVKRKDVVLAESFFKSPDFECIFNWNPKHNIDFIKQ